MPDKHQRHPHEAAARGALKDLVCGMDVVAGQAAGGRVEHDGTTYWFCSASCRERFVASPDRYTAPVRKHASQAGVAEQIYTCPMHPEIRQQGPGNCPKCGMALEPVAPPVRTRT